MIKLYKVHCFRIFIALAVGIVITNKTAAQTYTAPQDTVRIKRAADESLTTYTQVSKDVNPDSRMVGAAVKAAEKLKDTTKYDVTTGISIDTLFEKNDLEYFASKGIKSVVALFEQVNKYLPKDHGITFRTENRQAVKIAENPLVLKNLRAIIAENPATIRDPQQWRENVYHAYMARDYGTKLHNTITITSATREIRETPRLEIIDFDGSPITLGQILAKQQAANPNKYLAEKAAVAEFRARTFPSVKISKEHANENYKRALFELIRLQEGDLNRHPETRKVIDALINDLRKGNGSNVINSLKNNPFFDSNVPGNLGPVLLTEDKLLSAEQVRTNAEAKAMELMMLTALHYGERDAVKLFKQLINGRGYVSARQTGDFTPKRLGELTDHGTEKLKSLGYGADKTWNMTSSDLVLMAVAAPEAPVEVFANAFISMQQVGACIVNNYSTITTEETRNTVIFSPRIKFGTRHSEYRASFDPVEYVPEFVDGVKVNQKGAGTSHNGLELRLESDIYFTRPEKIIESGVKPTIFPQFGVILGAGQRKVGYDNNTTEGRFGPVPQYKDAYVNWGAHGGINIGPFLLSTDANYFTSQSSDEDPYKRFFDLSQGMTYYRYSLLTHLINFGAGKKEQGRGSNILVDFEFAGETNNTGFHNRTITPSGTSQINNYEWRRDYERARPGGVFNKAIAQEMILNGDVKATYAASNFAALHFGIQKHSLQIRGTLGLYNIYTVYKDDLLNGKLFSNTLKGNPFGAIGLTYTFGSKSSVSKRSKKETYQTTATGEGPRKVEESSSEQVSYSGPRDHAIFLNKKSKAKPVMVDVKP
ncbi:MAG TPA: hypothetical protein VGB63_00945 [Pedobacter sp.]|jgi:hypothetical protein